MRISPVGNRSISGLPRFARPLDISRVKAHVINVVSTHYPNAKCLEYSSALVWTMRRLGKEAHLSAILENGDPLHFYAETKDHGEIDLYPQGYTNEQCSHNGNISWKRAPEYYMRTIEMLKKTVPGMFFSLIDRNSA